MTSVERREDGVFIIWMHSGENRLNPSFVQDFVASLELAVSQRNECKAIVVATKTRWWSNGVDLDWIKQQKNSGGGDGDALMADLGRLCARLLSVDLPVVACLNGHAFGGGLMFALACDYRVSAPSRGYFCLPAVTLGVQLPGPLVGLLQAKVSPQHARDIALFGRRYGGVEAVAVGLVDQVADDPLQEAILIATRLSASGGSNSLGHMKRTLWKGPIEELLGGQKAFSGMFAKL